MFAPNKISGLALWLDASDLGTITKDGSNYVSEWRDKSGNAKHFTQATGSAQPLWSSNKITFDGSADYMSNAALTSVFNINTAYTIFTVFKLLANTTDQAIWKSRVASTNRCNYGLVSSSLSHSTNNNVVSVGASIEHTYDNLVIGIASKNTGYDTVETYENLTKGADTTALAAGGNPAEFVLGWNGIAVYSNMEVMAMVGYSSLLSDTDRIRVTNYLASKYGVAL